MSSFAAFFPLLFSSYYAAAAAANLSSSGVRKIPSSSICHAPSRSSLIKCQLLSQNPKPRKNSLFKSLSKPLALASAYAVTLLIRFFSLPAQFGGDGGGFGDGGNGFGSGGGRDGGHHFWERFFSPAMAIADESNESQDRDSHGLPTNIVVQLNKLSGFKRYKISEILFFDRRRWTTVGTEDLFFEMVSLRPGGIYTKTQLQKELENLATCGMFEKVDMEGKMNPDGTLGLTISFTESTWQSADRFRCINVGLMPQSKPVEMDPDMTDKEKLEYYRNIEKDYKRRIDRARPCLLPMTVHREVLQMLREQGKVSVRLLQKIRDRVQKWYHEEGYAWAQVVNFGNLNTKEVVCEVVEGDITQLVIQFQDKIGNVVEGNTQIPVVKRELPKQVDQGLGIGTKYPFFNRHQLTFTRFLQLKQVDEGANKPPPPVLVLHDHYGGCVGDLPSYDAFTLGGPYSVRGYNMGELGAARNIIELRSGYVVRNTHVYTFAEHGNDLGSSKDVKGNPTEVYRRMGHGSSYGVGVKLGLVRAEYADHNTGTGALFFPFGERY